MALTITTQANVVLTAGVNKEIVNALVGRKSIHFQVQAPGDVWVKLAGAAAVDDGFLTRGQDVINLDWQIVGAGNNSDFYEGSVNLFWVGGVKDNETDPAVTANCRVIETS